MRRRLLVAVEKTLGTLPDVVAVLWLPVDATIHIVSVLADRSEDAILRVADQEMALMDVMKGAYFEFRTAAPDRLQSFVSAGYAPILQKPTHDHTCATQGTGSH